MSPAEDAEEPPKELLVEPVKVVDASTLTESPKKSSAAPRESLPSAGTAPSLKFAEGTKPFSDPKTLKTGQTMPGGISPAIVYLQNLKLQIEHFEKEIHSLRSQVSTFAAHHDGQFNDLLKRMGSMQIELHHKVAEQHASAAKPSVVHAPAMKPVSAQAKVEPGSAAAGGAAAKPSVIHAPAVKPAVELKLAADPEPTVPVAAKKKTVEVKKDSSKSTAEEIASTLTLNAPSGSPEKPAKKEPAAPPKEEDILKPEKGKGPVWPV